MKVTRYSPEMVGVPLIVPSGSRWSPGGRAPAPTDHAYGGRPPLAESELWYGTPMVPTARLVVVTSGGADRVSMVPPKSSLLPTASQLTGLEHEMP